MLELLDYYFCDEKAFKPPAQESTVIKKRVEGTHGQLRDESWSILDHSIFCASDSIPSIAESVQIVFKFLIVIECGLDRSVSMSASRVELPGRTEFGLVSFRNIIPL